MLCCEEDEVPICVCVGVLKWEQGFEIDRLAIPVHGVLLQLLQVHFLRGMHASDSTKACWVCSIHGTKMASFR